jgi:hypothetical protein
MGQYKILTFFAAAALSVFAVGCAAQSRSAGSSASEPAAAIPSTDLGGTWRGSFAQVRRWSSSSIDGNVTLEMKDDGTYRLLTGSVPNDSGRFTADARGVTLMSSKGQSTRLARQGDTLHGMVPSSGGVMHISVQRIQ